jgi:hypothetical protein
MGFVIDQYIRLGTHAEAEYLRKLPTTFNGLVLNANLLFGTPAASVSLVYTLNRPYFIDPFTHAFASPPRFLQSRQKDKSAKVVPKRTFVGLANTYFGRSDFVGNSALSPSNVDPDELAERVLKYQKSWYDAEIVNDQFIAESGVLKPDRLIAPYFPLRHDFEWHDINLQALRASLKIDSKAISVVPISTAVLRNDREKVTDDYAATGVRGVLLWVENLDEDRADLSDLICYCDLLSKFSAKDVTVSNAFGGFFSCIAQHYGLAGFIHGLVYGENKGFSPVVGGGQPPPRYYFRPAHITMSVPEAELLLAKTSVEEYLRAVCDCAICARLMQGGDVRSGLAKFAEVDVENKYTPAAYALSRFHFLLARRKEVKQFGGFDQVAQRAALSDDRAFCLSLGAIDYAAHLSRWSQLIK